MPQLGPTAVIAGFVLVSAILIKRAMASETCTSADSRVSLGDGNMLPAVGLGLYYTPPGAVAQDIVREALRLGYRHLDTAGFYENEADVGRAVRESGIPREQIHITSKVWPEAEGRWVEDGFAAVLDAVNASVAALGTRADLYLIHWPVNPEQRIEYWLALEEAQRLGLARSIGGSNCGVAHLQQLIDSPRTSVVPCVPRSWNSRADSSAVMACWARLSLAANTASTSSLRRSRVQIGARIRTAGKATHSMIAT